MINRQFSYPKLMELCSDEEFARAQDYLSGYCLCEKMLGLRGYERKRSTHSDTPANTEQILQASEQHWELQALEIKALINGMRNGREKMVLYYHFIRGESVDSAARLIGISRRTAYRMLQKGIAMVAITLRQKPEESTDCQKNDGEKNA